MKKILLLTIVFCSISSCTFFNKYKPETVREIKEKIIPKISYLTNCRASGVANITLGKFEMKSQIMFWKKGSDFRMDFFAGGILGLSPSPKLQILNNDFLAIFFSDRKKLYIFDNSEFNGLIKNFAKNLQLTEITEDKQGNYLINYHKRFDLIFSKNYNLIELKSDDLRINFSRYINFYPYKIVVKSAEQDIGDITLDEWENIEIRDKIFNLKLPENFEKIYLSDLNELMKGK